MVMGKTILKWPLRCFGYVGVLIFFLFLMPTLGLDYSRTEAVMIKYVSGVNRGRKVTFFASAIYASGLKPRSKIQNNRGKNTLLH